MTHYYAIQLESLIYAQLDKLELNLKRSRIGIREDRLSQLSSRCEPIPDQLVMRYVSNIHHASSKETEQLRSDIFAKLLELCRELQDN